MTLEAYRRPGIPALLLLAILGLFALWFPKWITPPALVSVTDAACTGDASASLPGSPIPVVQWSFALDRLVASHPDSLAAVAHGHSVLAHLLAAVVLLGLLMRLGVQRAGAVCGTAVFLVHPTVFETVSIVGFRPLVLAGLWTFLCLAAVARGVHTDRRIHFLAAAVFASLAAACNPFAAAVLPALAGLTGLRVGGRWLLPTAGTAAPVLLVLAGYASWPLALDPLALGALAAPLVAIFAPATPLGLAAHAGGEGAAFGLGLVLSVVLLAIALRRRHPALATGLGLLSVGVVPAVWRVPLAPDVAGYLVTAGLAVVVGSLSQLRRAAMVVVSLSVLLMVVVDWRRDAIYRDAGSVFAAAGSQPLAAALHGEYLAHSEDGASQQRAIDTLRMALPQLPASIRKLGLQETYVGVLTRQGRAGEASLAAEQLCHTAETLADKNQTLRAYLLAAECFSIENYEAKVEEYIGRASRLAPSHPEVVAARAEREFAALVAAAGDQPKTPWIEKGDRRAEQIEALADQALSVEPQCFRARLLKGRILEARGDVLDALTQFERAIAVAPTRIEPRLLLTRLYMDNEMPQEAEDCVRAALAAGIDDPRLHFYLVMVLTAKGQSVDARQYLEVYVKNHSGSQQARVMLASLLSAQGLQIQDQALPEELRKLAARIALLNPEDPKGYLVRAVVLMRSKPPKFENYVKAIVLIENARLAMPGDADVVRRLAIAHRDFGWKLFLASKKELAMDHFQQFLKLAPASVERGPVLRTYRSHCLRLQEQGLRDLENGRAKAAVASLGRFTALLPLRSEGHFHLALARMEQSRFQDAVVAFEEAIRLGRAKQADVSPYVLPLLDTLQRMGRPAEARSRAETFLKEPGPAGEEMLEKIRQRISR